MHIYIYNTYIYIYNICKRLTQLTDAQVLWTKSCGSKLYGGLATVIADLRSSLIQSRLEASHC